MSVKNIEKHSFAYALLKHWVRFWHHFVFYRKVEYVNRDRVPLDKHLIFTPNHQNALMDALAIELSFSNQFVFLARSDIFNNKIIASILYFLKLLPVYRIRDGYDTLKKNQEIFDKTMDIIYNKNGFVIFPEGNHAGFRRLRSLKKGFARIAFQAEEASDYLLDMKVIPVGINYNHYENYRSDLLVVFGEPLDVSEFYDAHRSNPAVAYNLIKNRLSEMIKPLMIEIDSQYYELYHSLRRMFSKSVCITLALKPNRLYNRFRAEKGIINKLNERESAHSEEFPLYDGYLRNYLAVLNKMHFSHEEMEKSHVSILWWALKVVGLIAGFPLFVYGYINHFIPYCIPILVTRKISDPQFHSSFKFVLNMVLFPLAYVIQAITFGLIFSPAYLVWLYLASLPLSAAIAWNYAKVFKKVRRQWFFINHQRKNTSDFQHAEYLWGKIEDWMSQILKDVEEG